MAIFMNVYQAKIQRRVWERQNANILHNISSIDPPSTPSSHSELLQSLPSHRYDSRIKDKIYSGGLFTADRWAVVQNAALPTGLQAYHVNWGTEVRGHAPHPVHPLRASETMPPHLIPLWPKCTKAKNRLECENGSPGLVLRHCCAICM